MAGARGVRLRDLFRWPSPLERDIARRYLRSRRHSRFLSRSSVLAIVGVAMRYCAARAVRRSRGSTVICSKLVAPRVQIHSKIWRGR